MSDKRLEESYRRAEESERRAAELRAIVQQLVRRVEESDKS